MSFQAIRYYYERAVIAVCNSEGIEYRAENQLVPGGDASTEYVTARLQFTNFNEEVIGCVPPENIEGVFIVEHFCEKGIGPAKAQDVMQKIICNLISLNERPIDPDEYIGVVGGVGRISGPRFAALEMRPYFFAGISAPIRAAYYGPAAGTYDPTLLPGWINHSLTHHDDATVTAPARDDLLIYDGAQWVNEDELSGGGF